MFQTCQNYYPRFKLENNLKEQLLTGVTQKLKVSDKLLEKIQLIVHCEDVMYTGLGHINESQS